MHTGGYSVYCTDLTGPKVRLADDYRANQLWGPQIYVHVCFPTQGADIVSRLTATQMDPAAAETLLMTLPWGLVTVFQDTKQPDNTKMSIATSMTFWPQPSQVRLEHYFVGEMVHPSQIKPNTTYLCRMDHVDMNNQPPPAPQPRSKKNKEAATVAKRASPQKVKILSVSSC